MKIGVKNIHCNISDFSFFFLVERSFSILNLIKDSHKIKLEKESLEAQMRIR